MQVRKKGWIFHCLLLFVGLAGVSVQEVTPEIAAEFGLPKPEGALIIEVSEQPCC